MNVFDLLAHYVSLHQPSYPGVGVSLNQSHHKSPAVYGGPLPPERYGGAVQHPCGAFPDLTYVTFTIANTDFCTVQP